MKQSNILIFSLLLTSFLAFSSCSIKQNVTDNEQNQNTVNPNQNTSDENKTNKDDEEQNKDDEPIDESNVTDLKYFSFSNLNDGTIAISLSENNINGLPSDVVLPTKYNGVIISKIDDDGFNCFRFKTTITSLQLPKTLKEIGKNAFFLCSFQQIDIPNTVASIDDNAFAACSYLNKINIPDSLENLGDNVFSECKELKTITVGLSNEHFTSLQGVLLSKDLSNVIWNPSKNIIKDFVVPSQTKIIKQCAFYYSSIERLELSSSVEIIEEGAFYGCNYLSEIVFNDKLLLIGESAFSGIKAEELVIPNSVTTIGRGAFSGSLIEKITLPENLECINGSLFSNATKLEIVNVSKSIKEIGPFAFWHASPIINYPGTIDEWNAIEKDTQWYRENNDSFVPSTPLTIFCSDGTIEMIY